MTGLITKQFRLFYAEQFKELFSEESGDNIYLFIGRSLPWPDDNFPPTPLDTISRVQYTIWDDIISAKKINASDISFAAKRYNWTSGQTYSQYTANTEFFNSPYFVMNNEYQVYKCLGNNGGGLSTIKPTGRLTTPFTTGDGYQWKFLFEIPAVDAVKYITTDYLPVKKLTEDDGSYQWDVQAAAVNGSINTIGVASGGVNYKTAVGAIVSANTTSAVIQSTANTINGTYTHSSIYISSGTGSGQLRKISGYDGNNFRCYVTPPFSPAPTAGSGYIVSPTVTISQADGTGLEAYTTVSNGSIRAATVINAGANYSFADLTITANGSTGGSGATLVAQIAPYGGHGSDPVYELFGHNIVMNVKLEGGEEGTFYANNDFRIIGLIANPKLADGVTVANAISYMVAPQLQIANTVSFFSPEEKITGGTSSATGVLVEYSNSSNIILTNVRGTFAPSEMITGNTSGATAVVTSVTASPFTKYTGKILYLENRAPITRSEFQEEDLRIILTL